MTKQGNKPIQKQVFGQRGSDCAGTNGIREDAVQLAEVRDRSLHGVMDVVTYSGVSFCENNVAGITQLRLTE